MRRMQLVPRPGELPAEAAVLQVAPQKLPGLLDGGLFGGRLLDGSLLDGFSQRLGALPCPVLPPARGEDEPSQADFHEQDGPQHDRV